MKVVIDGSRLSKTPMGVTDICISIINAYAELYPQFEFYVLTHGPLHADVAAKLLPQANVTIVCSPLPFLSSNSFLWSLLKFNKLVKQLKPDVLIAPNFWINTFGFPDKPFVILYVHDLVYRKYRKTMNMITRTQMDLFFERSLKRADMIWVNSNYTKEEFESAYGYLHKPVHMGSGINPGFINRVNKPAADVGNVFYEKYGNDKKYLIFVGTVEPRKNLVFLLQLFELLAKKDYYLVIVGDMGWGEAQADITQVIEAPGYPKDKIFISGYVTTDELIRLYKDAYAFISTSFNEGLGLPLLEAMACGCPVIVPHNSAMIEVAENAGITVSSWDIQDWITAFSKLETERAQLISSGYDKVKLYNWTYVLEDLSIKVLKQLQHHKEQYALKP